MDVHVDRDASAGNAGTRFGRSRLLAGGLGAFVGLLVAKVRPAAADDVIVNPPLLLGQENVAGTTTGLLQDASSPALSVRNPSGPGILSSALVPRDAEISIPFAAGMAGVGERLGVVGASLLPGEMVITQVFVPPAAGVAGVGARLGVIGSSLLPGEGGISIPFEAGTAGVSQRVGVVGASLLPGEMVITQAFAADAGVVGMAHGADAVGMIAENRHPDGYALRAVGKVSFSAGGTGTVPAGASSVTVEDPAIGEDTLVNVTLMDDPGAPGIGLHYARPGRGSLRVVLTARARQATPFNYFVFDKS